MQATLAFETVLDAKLEDGAAVGDTDAGSIKTQPFGWRPDADVVRPVLPPVSLFYSTPWKGPSTVRPSTSMVRSLTSAQRDALTAMRRLGAPLADEFDACQLKAAFRRLALEFHPDRHPGADPTHRRWLGTRFAVLCEAYRTLTGPTQA